MLSTYLKAKMLKFLNSPQSRIMTVSSFHKNACCCINTAKAYEQPKPSRQEALAEAAKQNSDIMLRTLCLALDKDTKTTATQGNIEAHTLAGNPMCYSTNRRELIKSQILEKWSPPKMGYSRRHWRYVVFD